MKYDKYRERDPELSLTPYSLDRREFIKLLGGGIIIFFSVGEPFALQQARRSRREYPEDFNAYLRIGEDGKVSCLSGKIEMGQGVVTSLAQMLAEELDVPMTSVDMVMGDTALCPYDRGTFGSRSTKYFGPPLRKAAAEARAVLILLASERLSIPPERLRVKDGIVFDKLSPEKKVSYADLAKGQIIERHLDKKPPIKSQKMHSISGKSFNRTDGVPKVTGEARFAGDIHPPGMLYAKIVRPPAHGAKLLEADVSAAKSIEGAVIIQGDDLIAALHENPEAAERAAGKIKAKFEMPEIEVDNETIFQRLIDNAPRGNVVAEAGNIVEGEKLAAEKFKSSYTNQYVAHAPAEPHTAVAKIEGDKATVWASTQAPFRLQGEIAEILDLPSQNVRVITPFVGGGFGGKTRNQQAWEAARLAKLSGKPVQVAWSRKEEFFYDTFRPAAVIKIQSGVDDKGKIVFWDYSNYFAGDRSSQPFYNIPHYKVLSLGRWGGSRGSAHPFGVGAWRGPGSNTNVFAMESHIDRMAEGAGLSPLEFRLRNLNNDRMKKVLSAAADKFSRPFSKAPSGKGYGIACTDYLGTYVATMAEVGVDKRNGKIRVKRVVCAQDTGEVINPEGVRMQIEGCITMGLGYVFTEEIRFKGGQIFDENFDTYEIPRFSWTPKIETVLVMNPDMPPQGCGEPSITTMGAVIANAVFDATGIRMFDLPMTPARMKEALSQGK